MEANNQELGENRVPTSLAPAEAANLDIIRTETVLSRLPVHNLSKKGSISIQILKKTETGEVELLWRISPSRDYGEPRQLAYKLDTIIINQRIDEAGRPLPKLLRLGSLNDICAELGLTIDHGTNAKNIRNAFLQNALTGITAKFNYRANDGTERRLEAGFTRYSVIFTGEKLPDGRKADAVYIIFNEPFWEVLNNAPVRPLDRAYMKELPPAAQRFYEIISRKIFAALKNDYPRAKISYSEYCTFSAQLRHFERQRVQDQMAKVLRPHKASGYITTMKYEPIIDAQNQPDWILYFTPGPRARAEFAAAHGGRRVKKIVGADAAEAREQQPKRFRSESRQRQMHIEPAVPQPTFDPELVAQFTRRGITDKKAHELLLNLKPGQDVMAQLEHIDYMVQHARFPIINPPGFYINLIKSNTAIPDGFETSAKRKAREEKERKEKARRDAEDIQQQLEWDYDNYRDEEIDRYVAEHTAAFEALKDAKWNEDRKRFTFANETTAKMSARREIEKQMTFLSFEEFLERKKQGTDLFLKPVGPSPSPELATVELEDEGATATIEPGNTPSDPVPAAPLEAATHPTEPATETATEAAAQSEIQPAMPEPIMIELVSDPPQEQPNSSPAAPGLA